jgi:ABC-type branched-subunit amino acid transport system substrate-binding protein
MLGLPVWAQQDGVTPSTIRVAGVMDLGGDGKGLGIGMKIGIEAALKNQKTAGHAIEYIAVNDFYDPKITVEVTRKLIEQGIFAMLGNMGSPTAKASLPMLAEHKIPAIGFLSGSEVLRPGVGDVINFRASYVQETTKVIDAALSTGLLKPEQICAYVQNDRYGMAGVEGLKASLQKLPNTHKLIQAIERIQSLQDEDPARNNLGPVGFYQRNTIRSREGYASLKHWEASHGTQCRFVVTVGLSRPVANFIAYARYKGENWIVSAASPTATTDFEPALKQYKIADGIIMTQIVPALSSNLPIVAEARKALGNQLSYVTLEGYIVGRMFLAIMENIDGEVNRENFLRSVRGHKLDLGGLQLDFSDDNQGSDLVQLTYLEANEFKPINPEDIKRLLQ